MRSRLLVVALVLFSPGHAEELISGKFDLVDHQGRSVTERSYDGKLRLVFFGYTQCPDLCPTTLLEVARVMRRLGEDASDVTPIQEPLHS